MVFKICQFKYCTDNKNIKNNEKACKILPVMKMLTESEWELAYEDRMVN